MPDPGNLPERPSLAWRAALRALGRLPAAAMSRAFGAMADVRLPRPLRAPVLGGFARVVGVDVGEAERTLAEYPSLNEFFVRRLKAGLREWPADARVVASPVDGITGRCGVVTGGAVVQAKGRSYSLAELLDEPAEAARYEGGAFITLYLSPRHYHRIHSPCPGKIPRVAHIPGFLLPVNAPAVLHVADLFVRNERLICYVEGQAGRVAVVAVGAYNVGRISAAFDESWTTNVPEAERRVKDYNPPVEVETGEEIMAFHLGSTVVLVTEPGAGSLRSGIEPGSAVRLGEPLVLPG